MPDHDLPSGNFIGDYPVACDVTSTPLRHMNHFFPQYPGIVRVCRADEYVVAKRRRMHL
jgi:hypothetical protein